MHEAKFGTVPNHAKINPDGGSNWMEWMDGDDGSSKKMLRKSNSTQQSTGERTPNGNRGICRVAVVEVWETKP